jgi:hypothetical protein
MKSLSSQLSTRESGSYRGAAAGAPGYDRSGLDQVEVRLAC